MRGIANIKSEVEKALPLQINVLGIYCKEKEIIVEALTAAYLAGFIKGLNTAE